MKLYTNGNLKAKRRLIMNTTYETFKKDNRLKLFGHEDAGKEDDSRLTSYYYKTLQYNHLLLLIF